MKKNFLNKFMTHALLTVFLASGIGSVWGADPVAQEHMPKPEPRIEKIVSARVEIESSISQLNTELKKHKISEVSDPKDQAAIEKAHKAVETALQEKIDIMKNTNAKKEDRDAAITAHDSLSVAKKHLETIQTKTAEIKELIAEKPLTAKSIATGIWENKGKIIAVGVGGFAALGGIIGEILSVVGDISHQAKAAVGDLKKEWGIGQDKIENDNGIMAPNALPAADPNDPDYNKTLTDIVTLFADFDKDFKNMLEKNKNYNSNVIKIEVGTVTLADGTDVKVSIKYEMEPFAVGLALVPVLITLDPQEINGFALTPNDVLSKMSDGAAKKLLALILNPTASLIFTIKLILMFNAISNDSMLSDSAKIEKMLDEVTKLNARFILSKNEDIAPDSLLSYLEDYPAIFNILKEKQVTIYKDLYDDINTPLDQQKTAFMDMTKSDLGKVSLTDAIKIYYNHFYQIYFKKFEHDNGFVDTHITPGPRQIKNMLFAIFFRALKDIDQAGQELASINGNATLRKLDGTQYSVDPESDFTDLIANPSAGIEAAKSAVKDTIKGIQQILASAKAAKQAVKANDLQSADDAYIKAFEGLKTANDVAANAIVTFRKKFAPFYPLTWDDGTSMTPGEFLVANIAQLNKIDPRNMTILSKVYSPFQRIIGLTQDQLLGTFQDNPIDFIATKVVSQGKTVLSKKPATKLRATVE